LGWNLLNYTDGWPFVVDGTVSASDSGAGVYLPNCFYLTMLMCMWTSLLGHWRSCANLCSFMAVHMVIVDALAWYHSSIPLSYF
jgi:hypothetical protein